MPRIKSATVKEHRAAQQRVLLDAARELITEGGPAAVKFGELADRAGLARSSVYEYFRTREDVLVAVLDDELHAWHLHLQQVLNRVTGIEAQVETFLSANLRRVRQGRHGLEYALGQAELPTHARQLLEQRHSEIFDLLRPVVSALAPHDVALGLLLLKSTLRTGMDLAPRVKGVGALARQLTRFFVQGLRAAHE
jgi:AcrR family transcriptional regulator